MLEWELLLISAATSQHVTQHPEMTHRMFTKVICAAGERGVGNFKGNGKKKRDAYLPKEAAAGFTFPH